MKGTPASGPLPRNTETRARPSRVGRMTCLSPAAEISISSARSATNSESIATGEPGVGASVVGRNGMPDIGEVGEILFILERLLNGQEQKLLDDEIWGGRGVLHGPTIIKAACIKQFFPIIVDSMAG